MELRTVFRSKEPRRNAASRDMLSPNPQITKTNRQLFQTKCRFVETISLFVFQKTVLLFSVRLLYAPQRKNFGNNIAEAPCKGVYTEGASAM